MLSSVKCGKYFIRLGLVLAVVIAAGVCLLLRSASPGRDVRQIILISIDTCRADYLSCYGYQRPTTPNIDALAAEGILFENAISPVPLTLPAHSSMLTGTIPAYHGVRLNDGYQLSKSHLTLAEILAGNGFQTGAIVSAAVLDSQFGLDQGFDSYNDEFEDASLAVDISERKAEEASRFARQWLEEQKDEKFFLFLHYYDPHFEYVPPEPFASRFAGNAYAGEIAYTDHCIGEVLAKLKELGLYDSALIIITSDHGEMLGEHGEKTHGYFIYQGAIRVPLIFKLPGRRKAQTVNDLVGTIDITATICSMVGIEVPKHVQGQDLSAYFAGKSAAKPQRSLYCESMEPTHFGANVLRGVVCRRFKYIQTTRPEFYDLVKDPAESNNLLEKEQEQARIMKDQLAQILAESAGQDSADSKIEMDAETRARLESLGYVGGQPNEDIEFGQNKQDPKDLIEFVGRYNEAVILFHQKKYNQAISAYDKAVALNPRFARTYNYRGLVFFFKDDYDRAIRDYDKSIELDPSAVAVYNNRGIAYRMKGNYRLAIRDFDKAIELNPKLAASYANRGTGYLGKQEYNRAVRDFDKVIELDPDDAVAHRNIAHALERLGRDEEAVRHYRQALRLRGDWPEVLNNLAWMLATHEDLQVTDKAEAVQLAEQACQLVNYKVPGLLDTLAAAYAQAGQFGAAVRTAEKAFHLVRIAGKEQMARDIQSRLKLYRAKHSYRESFSTKSPSRPELKD